MRVSDKILLMWLAFMWMIFSIWIFTVSPFPLNCGFIAWQLLAGIVLMWTMNSGETY